MYAYFFEFANFFVKNPAIQHINDCFFAKSLFWTSVYNIHGPVSSDCGPCLDSFDDPF